MTNNFPVLVIHYPTLLFHDLILSWDSFNLIVLFSIHSVSKHPRDDFLNCSSSISANLTVKLFLIASSISLYFVLTDDASNVSSLFLPVRCCLSRLSSSDFPTYTIPVLFSFVNINA